MFAMAWHHSSGCNALKTKIITTISTLHGSTFSGRVEDDKSHKQAAIVPAGGDSYSG
jgi:hypothetical protein